MVYLAYYFRSQSIITEVGKRTQGMTLGSGVIEKWHLLTLCLYSDSLPVSCLDRFLYSSTSWLGGIVTPTADLAPIYLWVIKTILHVTVHRPTCWKQFLNWGLSSPITLRYAKLRLTKLSLSKTVPNNSNFLAALWLVGCLWID